MKIVHICLCGPMTDGFSYQENIITKYHQKMGYSVTIIASEWIWDQKGNLVKSSKSHYVNNDGVKVIRIPTIYGNINNRFKTFPTLYKTIEEECPDILFIHDCQFLDIKKIAKYVKKNPNIKVYVDNHVDTTNGAHGWLSKNILHKIIWKNCVKKIEPYVRKFYGVLPARVDFLIDMYDISKSKCELLVMGADDELIHQCEDKDIIHAIRMENGILDDDLLIVTGGKINKYRPETLDLMKAIIGLNNKNIKLLVFGNPSDDLKEEFLKLCKNDNIIYVGWINSAETYRYMAAADIVVFPGLHSVMWEQAVALGKPCIFRDIDGFHHVDLSGNCEFINDVSVDGISKVLGDLLEDKDKISIMENKAKEKGPQKFAYSKIAEESLK